MKSRKFKKAPFCKPYGKSKTQKILTNIFNAAVVSLSLAFAAPASADDITQRYAPVEHDGHLVIGPPGGWTGISASRNGDDAVFALNSFLRLSADPSYLERHPELFLSFLDEEGQGRYRKPSDSPYRYMTDSVFAGSNQFEIKDTITRFLAEQTQYLNGLVPSLPLDIEWRQELFRGGSEVLGYYDEARGVFPEPLEWKGGGISERYANAAAPMTFPSEFRTDAALARRLVEAAQDSAHVARRDPNRPGVYFVVRYRISAVRLEDDETLVMDTRIRDAGLFLGNDFGRPVVSIPLADDALRIGDDAAPILAAGPSFIADRELPYLLIAANEPERLKDTAFVAEAFETRRRIERENAESCGAGVCEPTSWNNLMPPILLRSDAKPSDAEIAGYTETMKARVAELPQTIRFADICEKGSDVCELVTTEDGEKRLRISLADYFSRPRDGVTMPDLVGYSVAGKMFAVNGLDSGSPNEVGLVLAPSGNWHQVDLAGLESIPTRDQLPRIDADFRIKGMAMTVAANGAPLPVIALEPAAIGYNGADGMRVEAAFAPVAETDLAVFSRPADKPYAPFEVLGVRLGMPLDEAITAISGQFPAAPPLSPKAEIERVFGTEALSSECMTLYLDYQAALKHETYMAGYNQELSKPTSPLSDEELAASAFQKVRETFDPKVIAAGCGVQAAADTATPSETAAAFMVEADRGAFTERLSLFSASGTDGKPYVTAVYREFDTEDKAILGQVHQALVEKYGRDRIASVSSGIFNEYWIESPLLEPRFRGENARCAVMTSYTVGVPDEYRTTDCGAVLASYGGRVLLVDTHHLAGVPAITPDPAANAAGSSPVKF